jgi:hypothetical protein
MTDKNIGKNLQDALENVVSYQKKQLSHRDAWGSINFEEVNSELQTVLNLSATLQKMPIHFLPDATVNEILTAVKNLLPKLDAIDKFSLEDGGELNQRRARIISDLHQSCDFFYQKVGIWIPFLAYQNGNVEENIKHLQDAIETAERKAGEYLDSIRQKEEEVKEIVTRTREASADAGVAVFTEDFRNEAEASQSSAKKWLIATVVFAILTLIIPVWAYFYEDYTGLERIQLLSKLASKIVVISVLLTATLWCGRLYKSMRHLAIINRHRSIGLKTFRAFSAAASDETTKNAVLMETTRSIFSNGATGLIHEASADSDPNVIQIAGKVMETASSK